MAESCSDCEPTCYISNHNKTLTVTFWLSNEDLCYGLFFTAGTADMKVVKWWRRPAAEVIRMCMVRLIPDVMYVFVILIQTDSIIQL